jgi:hypothetical protein
MEPVCKNQISEMDIYKALEKVKSSKVIRGKEGSQIKKDS